MRDASVYQLRSFRAILVFSLTMSTWSTYLVRCADGSLYTGISTDVLKRIECHNAAKGAVYTRSRRPVVLVWHETAASESAARKREAEIKRLPKAQKERLIGTGEKFVV